jgi:hypothetical protein
VSLRTLLLAEKSGNSSKILSKITKKLSKKA